MRPPFITVEGIDGAGKSSHMATLRQALNDLGYAVVNTAEPGGTPLGEVLRMQIKQSDASALTKALMAFASRSEHLDKVIWPALDEGKAVISDRFTDSTFGYQGAAGGCAFEHLVTLEKMVHPTLSPDMTLFFDIDPVVAEARRAERLAGGATDDAKDVFDTAGTPFMKKVREGLLWRQERDPDRFARIDAGQSFEAVQTDVQAVIAAFVHRFQAKQQADVSVSSRPEGRRRRLG